MQRDTRNCEIWCSLGGNCEEYCLVESDATMCGRSTFPGTIGNFYQTKEHHNKEGTILQIQKIGLKFLIQCNEVSFVALVFCQLQMDIKNNEVWKIV